MLKFIEKYAAQKIIYTKKLKNTPMENLRKIITQKTC